MGRALVIVDVQRDFCEDGTLALAGGEGLAAEVSRLLREQGTRWEHVVATKDHHIGPGPHLGDPPDYVDSWPPHCVVGTDGAEFHPALDKDRVEAVFTKGAHAAAYSGFEGTAGSFGLAAWLRRHDVTAADVVGIATDHCVRATALDAAREGFHTTVLLGLTAPVAHDTTKRGARRCSRPNIRLDGTPVLPD